MIAVDVGLDVVESAAGEGVEMGRGVLYGMFFGFSSGRRCTDGSDTADVAYIQGHNIVISIFFLL